MSTLADALIEAGLRHRLVTERTLAGLLGSGKARRYGLVNRALKDGSLIRLKRGLYTLSDRHRSTPPHAYAIAQALRPGSYVSLETALGYHGWIPEVVFETASIVPGRKSFATRHPRYGRFTFSPLAVNRYRFLISVQRIVLEGRQTALIASPLRALMDLVALRRCAWQGLAWLSEGLRIDADALAGLSRQDFETLSGVYRHKAANAFLAALQDALVGGNTTSKEAAQLVSAATAAPIRGASSMCRVS